MPTRPVRLPPALLLFALLVVALAGWLVWPADEHPPDARLDATASGAPSFDALPFDAPPPQAVPIVPPTRAATDDTRPAPPGHVLELSFAWTCEEAVLPAVRLLREDDGWTTEARLRHRVRFDGLADGTYRVEVADRAWRHAELRVVLAGDPGIVRRDVAVDLRGRVAGTIVRADGVALDGVQLQVEADRGRGGATHIYPDDTGAFCEAGWELDDDARSLRVVADAEGCTPAASDWIAVDDPRAFVVEVALVLRPQATLSGHVVDAFSGAPLAAKVVLRAPDARERAFAGLGTDAVASGPIDTRTDASGAYRFALDAPCDVVLVALGQGAWTSDVLHLEPGEERALDLSLARPATLSGRVVAPATLPVPPHAVASVPAAIFADTDAWWTDLSPRELAPDGTFVLDGLPGGPTKLLVFADPSHGMPQLLATRDVELVSGATTDVEVVLGATTITGRVAAPSGLVVLGVACFDREVLLPCALSRPLDADGTFALTVTHPGRFVLLAEGGSRGGEDAFWNDPQDEPEARLLTWTFVDIPDGASSAGPCVLDATRTTLSFVPPDAGRLRFVALTSPDDPRLDAWLPRHLAIPRQSLTLYGLPPGRYRVTADGAGAREPLEVELLADVPRRVDLPR
ncbi:MAG: carboxypeptidase regulatory-like domain-containing protein [Planctomycetes bacterium]|nr:carboxypeptidase regulatory-like domain-containing protein [Planctomycetota bacterium]